MRGVAREEDAPAAISIGDKVARDPAQRRHHLVRNGLAHDAGDEGLRVHRLRFVEIFLAIQHQAPELAAVELHQRAPDALRVGEEMQRGLALVVLRPELRRAKEDVEIVFEGGRAEHLDAQRLRNRAVPAAAGDEIVGGNFLPRTRDEIMHGHDHAGVVLLEGLEPAREPHGDAGKAHGVFAQDRIEPELVAALRPFRADGARRAAAMTGPLDARDLEARQRREIEHGVRIVLRRAGLAHLVRDPQPPEELHGAGILGIGAGMRDGAVALLDQEAFDAAPTEIGGKAEAHRSSADDQHGCVGDIHHRLFSITMTACSRT